MDAESTYRLVGLPDAAATALLLVSLSIMLAPWFGGLELGPLKVPRMANKSGKLFRVIGPTAFLLVVSGFYPAWTRGGAQTPTNQISELGLRWLEDQFGLTTWDGGPTWGEIVFSENGREARYSNAPGRSGGTIQIVSEGEVGSGFIMFAGVWMQDDGKEGDLTLVVSGYGNEARVLWGPDSTIEDLWKMMPAKVP